MKVSDIMSGRVVTICQDEPVIAAARLLKRMNLGALPVTDRAGRLRGMLTDRDIVLRCVASGADAHEVRVGDIMTRGVVTAGPDTEVGEAARSMGGGQVRRLPSSITAASSACSPSPTMARSCDMEAAAALAEISTNIRRLKKDG